MRGQPVPVAGRVEPVGEQAQVEAPQAARGETGEDPGERRGKRRDVGVVELGDRRAAAEDRHRVAEHPDRGERHEPRDAPSVADPPRATVLGGEQIVREPPAGPRHVRVRRDEQARDGVAGRGGHDDLHVRMNLRPAGRRHVVPGDDAVGVASGEPWRDEAREVARGGKAVDDQALGHRAHRVEVLTAQDARCRRRRRTERGSETLPPRRARGARRARDRRETAA